MSDHAPSSWWAVISSARVYDTAQPLSWWQDVYRRGAGVYRGA